MEPTILDIYTSSSTSPQKKKVFSPGESIQWNVIHAIRDPADIGRPYRVYWRMEYFRHNYANAGDFEVLFRPHVVVRGNLTYRWEATHNWWWFNTIPEIPADLRLPSDEIEALEALRDGRPLQMFWPGFWKLTVHLMMSETDTGRPFATMSDWYYAILS